MQWHKSVLKSIVGKAALAAAALGGFMFFGGASSAQAAPVYVYHRPVARYYVAPAIGRCRITGAMSTVCMRAASTIASAAGIATKRERERTIR